jgi:cytoskeletal protein CcmA (bactofilin family)
MNKKTIGYGSVFVLLLAAGIGTLAAAQGGTQIGYKKDIVVAAGTEQQQLVAWGGTVNIEGNIRQDVLVVGSEVTVSGRIGDSFVAIGARVTLKPTAVVEKDLIILGGTLVREEGSAVKGDTVYFKSEEVRAKFLKGGIAGLFGAGWMPFFLIMKVVSLFIWAILIVIVAGVFPKNVTLSATELRRSMGPALLTGLVATIAYTFLMIFAAFLSIILIGIPLLIALAFAAVVIKVFGRVVVYLVVGRIAAGAFSKASLSPMAGAMVGLGVVTFIGFIPIFGALFSFFLSLLAWGIALRTKFGMTENWFRKTPPRA